MIMSVIKRYSLQLIFTLSLLFGLQLPNLLQQYELRLQGHFSEAELQLSHFQSLADVYFSGDIQALMQKHRNSEINLFQDEAQVIEASYLRVQFLQKKMDNMSEPIWYRLIALAQEIKQPIFNETWQSYQANIVLNQQAIMVGISIAVVLTLLFELFCYLIGSLVLFLFGYMKKSTKPEHHSL